MFNYLLYIQSFFSFSHQSYDRGSILSLTCDAEMTFPKSHKQENKAFTQPRSWLQGTRSFNQLYSTEKVYKECGVLSQHGNILQRVDSWEGCCNFLSEFFSGVCKKNSGLHQPLGNAKNSHGLGWRKRWATEGANQCFSKLAQNNWGGCLLFTRVNLISFVGGSELIQTSSGCGTKLSRATFSISQNMPLISIKLAGASIRRILNQYGEN